MSTDNRHIIEFRALSRDDFPRLAAWLRQPHIERWWNDDASPAALERDYGGAIDGSEPSRVFIARLDGEPIGLIQSYRLGDYPSHLDELHTVIAVDPCASSIDYFVGPAERCCQGIGTQMIAAYVRKLWADDGDTPSIVVPTNALNRASWRSLERAGFTRLAEGDLSPDNPIDPPRHFLYRLARPGAATRR